MCPVFPMTVYSTVYKHEAYLSGVCPPSASCFQQRHLAPHKFLSRALILDHINLLLFCQAWILKEQGGLTLEDRE